MKYFILSLLALVLVNCKNKKENSLEKLKLSRVKIIETVFNFGNINVGDTVKYSFIIKNISERKFIIDTVGTSCGCTTTQFTRDSVRKNEIAKIDVQYIADQSGKISKSIVVSDNSETGFQTFYLKGKVE
jgi:hypothetical protein